MQKGHLLEFDCQSCSTPIQFSLFNHAEMSCPHCQKKYVLNDPVLKRQLEKFHALCSQIAASEEILADTSVAVTVGEREVKFPYKLLLTRLTSHLELKVGNEKLSIKFRMEPLNL